MTMSANKHTVRTTRARIIHIRNDYKGIMSQIEMGLHEYHASIKSTDQNLTQSPSQAPTAFSNGTAPDSSQLEIPFAKVNSVMSGSPAEVAGLKAGDVIRRFGDISWTNHEKLSKVTEMVQRNEGVSKATN